MWRDIWETLDCQGGSLEAGKRLQVIFGEGG